MSGGGCENWPIDPDEGSPLSILADWQGEVCERKIETASSLPVVIAVRWRAAGLCTGYRQEVSGNGEEDKVDMEGTDDE